MQDRELIEYSIMEDWNYRSILNFKKSILFGLEIELETIHYQSIKDIVIHGINSTWEIKREGPTQYGIEVVSPPLKNENETWRLLLKLSEILQLLNPTFGYASFQVNLDNFMEKDKIVPFLHFFATYEDIIFRFSKGKDNHLRDNINAYASPIIPDLTTRLRGRKDKIVKYHFQNKKEYAINLKTNEYKKLMTNQIPFYYEEQLNTPISIIEFRTPNGTDNAVLWQNYINTFYFIMAYVNSDSFDSERFKNSWQSQRVYQIDSYEVLNMEKAIAFANLIFEEDIDKIYFLKQYIGDDYSKVKI